MAKKIFEIANDLGVPSLEIVEILRKEGFEIRNHMSKLEDNDVEKAMALLNKPKETPKATKKKVTKKKKVAKKKVTKAKAKSVSTVKDAGELKKTAAAAAAKKTTKKTTVRKKAVRRKKEDIEAAKVAAKKEKLEDTEAAPTGLRVVSAPPSDTSTVTTAESKTETTEDSAQSKEYLSDSKQHSFTPVFIPEGKPESKTTSSTGESKSSPAAAPAGEAKKVDGEGSKKRLGDLAAMVAKNKAGGGKARDLTQMRADEEMKNYVVQGATGKTIFTPVGKKKIYSGATKQTMLTETKESKRVVYAHQVITVEDLAQNMGVKFDEFRDDALEHKLLLKKDDYVGIKLANMLAEKYKYRVEDKAFDESTVFEGEPEEEDQNLKVRNPIITIMGHVDHGKTTLIDHIRKAKVVEGEAGGITQHIGAYSVKVKKSTLTFLDTPGHAAFGNIRQRGADVTDIVILVVAADDGVMPQTKESIKFCQNAGVPIIIAVNKMDKEGVNPDKVKQELMEFDLTPEEWGGQTQFIPISALKGDGVDDLLEAIHLQAEIMELKANPKGAMSGVVIESKMEKGRGAVATILVQSGTLEKGDYLVVGETYGRARSLMDYSGKLLKSAGPSTPVEVLGLNEAPGPGDAVNTVKNERAAKKVVENRIDERKEIQASKVNRIEDFVGSGDSGPKILKLIVRADVQGSHEAIKNSLESLGNDEVGVQVIGGGVGAITESDVELAASASGYILGFNMRPVTSARRLAEERGVDVKTYSIIYELLNDMTLALEGMLEPEHIEIYIGRAQVKETFSIPNIGVIAGSSVVDGKIQRGCNIRLLRDGKIVFDGKMSSLKRFKDDAKEVPNGTECGIALESFNDIHKDDLFEAYMLEKKERKLEEQIL